MLGLVAMGVLAPAALPQSGVTTTPETPPEDRGSYLNQPVDHPEALSGVWETSNGQGGAVGIHLRLMTTVSGDADPPVWTPQLWQHLELGVFERKGPELVRFGEENGFADDFRGGAVTLENGRLQLHFVSPWEDTPSIDLDLLHQPDGCWYGRFHRGSFDSVVALCRPTKDSAAAPSPLAGTWSNDIGGCIHIFETGPGTFTGWTDSLEIPGHIIFSDPGPHSPLETYGELAKVRVADDGVISLEVGAHNGMCCPNLFEGKLSTDGSEIQRIPPPPNVVRFPPRWTKMAGDSCVDPAAVRKLHPKVCPSGKD